VELGVLHYFKFSLALIIKALVTSETSVTFYEALRLNVPEDTLNCICLSIMVGVILFLCALSL
jgi:hypothetical protein